MKEHIEGMIELGYSRQVMADELGINIYKLKRILKKLSIRMIKEKFDFTDKCKHCDNMVEYTHFERKDVYCGRSCANKRDHSDDTKEKIRSSVLGTVRELRPRSYKNCLECGTDITMSRKRNLFCSISCSSKHRCKTDEGKENIRKMVEKSINTQVRRSKNEILFFEMCSEYFNNVDNNKPIFNGWDADVIIHDHKLAVLWNGKWHYEKIREGHSLLQVQNRDRIKIKEIERYGYKPYVIKDMGRFSKEKVEMEFNTLIEHLNVNSTQQS